MHDITGTMHNWTFTAKGALTGTITKHPRYPDGSEHTTAKITDCWILDGRQYAKSLSHVYELSGLGLTTLDSLDFYERCKATEERKAKSGK